MRVFEDLDVDIVRPVSHALFDLGQLSHLGPAGGAHAECRGGENHHQGLVLLQRLVDGQLIQVQVGCDGAGDVGDVLRIGGGMGHAGWGWRPDGRRAGVVLEDETGLGENRGPVVCGVIDVHFIQSADIQVKVGGKDASHRGWPVHEVGGHRFF